MIQWYAKKIVADIKQMEFGIGHNGYKKLTLTGADKTIRAELKRVRQLVEVTIDEDKD